MCLRVALRLCVHGISWLCLASAATAADPTGSVLHLTNGGFAPGELRASEDSKVLRWHSPLFARPFDFPLGAVTAVHYTVPAAPPRPQGEFCFELVNDDVLYGNLLGLTDNQLAVDSARVGRVHLRREHVRRFYRWEGANPVYLGPNGLAGWKDLSTRPYWRDEGGQPVTDQPGAMLVGDVGLPDKAVIEVEFSWQRKPDFVFALGVDDRESSAKYAFHLAVWDGELVAVGESARDADVASVQPLRAGAGSVRVQMFLDQGQRRLIVLTRNGKPLATLNISEPKPQILPGVRLTNVKGDVRLEHLRVTRWNGLPPREVREDQSRLHRTDGSVVYGRLAAFDPESKQFTVRDGTTETLVKHGAIANVFLAPSATGKAPTDAAGATDPILRLVYRDGSRFTGTLTRVEDAHLALACPSATQPLRLPIADVRSLIPLRHWDVSDAGPAPGRRGRLEMDGVSLQGRLVDGGGQPGVSCLVWHPDLSLNASPLQKGISGRIVYREPPAPPRAVPQVRHVNEEVMFLGGFREAPVVAPNAARTPPPTSGRRSLHLRTGDTIPCEVTRIDEEGVTFKSPMTRATFVAHERIKSVELIDARSAPGLEEAKRDRLLTLPRLQRDSPPTHLICAKSGDFLRGRIVEMDDKRLKVEVRLEVKEVPRDRVAQIIWLHADELTDGKVAPPATNPSRPDRVQIVQPNGNRLTFVAEKSDHKTISGTSDVLGACRVDLAEADQLLIGTFIEQSAAKLAYHLWKLHHAAEPKFVQAEAEAGEARPSGTESPLVGQPAFAFRLDMLDGTRFNLSDRKGRVVVLDFWATWCGPCMQSMPLVEGVAREFADRGVELVAVNLEEQPEQVKSMLERHKLKVPVALDRDGKVAAKYAVTAIPQTVVIDREGKVVRVFVGGGKNTVDALRTVLQELAADKSSPAAPR